MAFQLAIGLSLTLAFRCLASNPIICNTTEIATPSDLTASLPSNNFTLGGSSLDTINTGLSISDQFPGAVTLPNLVNASIQLVGTPKVTSTLTSLLFPNLSSANAIYFWSCDSLETISLPNLWQADDINIQNLTNLSSGMIYHTLGGLGEAAGEIAGIEIVNTTAPFITIGAPLPNPEAEKLTSIGKINFLEIYSNFLLEQTTVYAVNITTLQIENCKNVTIVAFTIGVLGLATLVDIDYLDASTVIETGSTLLENNSFTNLNFSQLKVAAIPGSILGSLAGIPPCYLWISGNWKLENMEFDSLESIESNLTISNNTVLSDISFPSLLSVAGAITIEVNGPQQVISFPLLRTIGGPLSISGDIKSIELSDLTQAQLGFIINSTNPSLNCSEIKTLADLGVFRSGGYTCISPSQVSTSPPASPSASPFVVHNSSHGLSTGTKIGVSLDVSLPILFLLGCLVGFLIARRKKHTSTAEGEPSRSEMPLGKHHEKTELDAPIIPQELLVPEVHEMPDASERLEHALEEGVR